MPISVLQPAWLFPHSDACGDAERGAELCGLTLEELWQQTLDAVRSCEDSINRQMEEI